MDINGASLNALFTGFKSTYQNAFNGVEAYWPQIATMVPSSTRQNDYGWLGQLPGFREWIGDRVITQISGHGYSIKNKSFELTVSVDRDDISDDNLGMYTPLVSELGRSAAAHPDELIFNALKAGETSECYDGQYFFDTDHPVGEPGKEESVSNMTAGAGDPWFLMDTSRALKPMIYQKRKDYEFVSLDNPEDANVFLKKQFIYGADGRGAVGYGFWQMAHQSKAVLDKANFRLARNAMTSLKNDNGRPLGIKPNILVVGNSNADAARDLILADRLENGSSNTDRNRVEIVEVPWLD